MRYPEAFGVRIGKSAIFPAEVCAIAPGQVYKRKLDGRDTTKFLEKSTVRPDARIRDIQQAISRDVSLINHLFEMVLIETCRCWIMETLLTS